MDVSISGFRVNRTRFSILDQSIDGLLQYAAYFDFHQARAVVALFPISPRRSKCYEFTFLDTMSTGVPTQVLVVCARSDPLPLGTEKLIVGTKANASHTGPLHVLSPVTE